MNDQEILKMEQQYLSSTYKKNEIILKLIEEIDNLKEELNKYKEKNVVEK